MSTIVKLVLIIVLDLCVVVLMEHLPAHGALNQPSRELDQLAFGVHITPGMVDWFNLVARPNDIAGVTVRELALLDRVKAGRRQVIFASVAEAERVVPTLTGKIDLVSYDIEHWPQTPADEQADPVGSVVRLRKLADRHGLQAGVGPDRRFLQEHGPEMAAHVDQVGFQLQRLQQNQDLLVNFARPLISTMRRANPKILINVQLNTSEGVDGLVDLTSLLKDEVDVVSILYTPASQQIVKDYVARIRTSATVSPRQAITSATPASVTPTRTETDLATATRVPPVSFVNTPVATETTRGVSTQMPPVVAATPLPSATPALPSAATPQTQCALLAGSVLVGVGLVAFLGKKTYNR